MKLISVSLKNFRCYQDETNITIGDLTTFIGRNDVGKSSILEALEIFFNNETVKIDTDDCNINAVDRIIEITCEFTDLPDKIILDSQAETSLTQEFLLTTEKTLKVKKTFNCNNLKAKEEVFVLADHPTASQYEDLLTLTNSALKKRMKDLEINETEVQLTSNPSIRQAIWGACQNLDLTETAIPVAKEDSKQIWQKLSEHLPLFALFQSDRASKDSDDEVQDPMKLAVATALNEPDIKPKLFEIVDAVKKKAIETAKRTQTTLTKIDPGLAEQLTPEFKTDPKWTGLFSLTLNTDQNIPVNKRGSGIRRLILVAFFRAEAERCLAEGKNNNIIYAIEEPETSQHPHNQRILLESFQDLASEQGCQVILTTHNPGFASYLPMDSFRFIEKCDENQTHIKSDMTSNWKSVVDSLGIVPDNRVRIILCVEGPTDVTALTCMSHALNEKYPAIIPDLETDERIAFVVLGGATLKHWVNEQYLKKLGRPEVHIYDNDVDTYADVISTINGRGDKSWAVLTNKHEIENYLHPEAIKEGLNLDIEFGNDDDVPSLFKNIKDIDGKTINWNHKTAKKKLARYAFPKMNAERIAQRDPKNEVYNWFKRIGEML